jgi:hypothetical protein
MNGGKLVQHCTGHAMFATHSIISKLNNTVYEITSTHHQMQYPYNLDNSEYTIIANSAGNRSISYEGDSIDAKLIAMYGEPEIVLYHKENMPRCLAIQGHPEYMRKESPIVKYLNFLINTHL